MMVLPPPANYFFKKYRGKTRLTVTYLIAIKNTLPFITHAERETFTTTTTPIMGSEHPIQSIFVKHEINPETA